MNAIHFIKILLRYAKWLLLVPLICAATVFFLTKKAKKQYTSSTTLYTGVASGYSITSTDDERLDYFAVNNAFDNLLSSAKSRETIEQVALHLLAEHLALKKCDPLVLSAAGCESLKKLAGNALLAKAKTFKDTQGIYDYISTIYASKNDNLISKILNQPGTFYSIDDLKSNLVVTRINTSDMIQVTYACTDPAVCQRTLELHSSIFTANYKQLKSDQTFSAVQYFEAKLAESQAKLQKSEDDLRIFGQQHQLINYYEQTRYVAEHKENLDKEIYTEKATQSGSRSALSLLNNKLTSRGDQVANGLKMVSLRQHLSQANADLEKANIYNNKQRISELSNRVGQLEDSLKAESNRYLNLNYTAETIPRPSLMQEFVDNAVADKKSTAGLAVLNNQKQNYLKEIDDLAPLGSTLKRLERQIDINEKEYLAILHGLSLAKLRQSNLALSSNIAIQDKPYFPLQALPSTRNLLIILSFFAGFIIVASVVLGREFMDSSVRSPERARKIINLPVAGISITNDIKKQQPYHQQLRNLLAEKFISTILPFISKGIEEKGKARLSFISTKNEIFSATDVQLLHQSLSSIYHDLFWIVPRSYAGLFATAVPANSFEVYTPSIVQLNYKDVEQLVSRNISANSVIIHLSPNLSQSSLPSSIAKAADLTLMVFRADDTWSAIDKQLLLKTKAAVAEKPLFTWLVNVDETNLDGVIGEIPKSRSWIRRKVKKMITLNLR